MKNIILIVCGTFENRIGLSLAPVVPNMRPKAKASTAYHTCYVEYIVHGHGQDRKGLNRSSQMVTSHTCQRC